MIVRASLRRSDRWWARSAVITSGCILLLIVGFFIDLHTDQELVVAIGYNVPIVASSLLLSVRLTMMTIGLSLVANLVAGYENAVASDGVDVFIVANRVLAAVSFLLVGAMTLLFEQRAGKARELEAHEEDGRRERELRRLLVELSGDLTADEVMERAASGLREVLRADAVVISGLEGARFTDPRWASPDRTSTAAPGSHASWAADALPATSKPVITVRDDRGLAAIGRFRRGDEGDLIVVVRRPDHGRVAALFGDALAAIEPLYRRAARIEALTNGSVIGDRAGDRRVAPVSSD